MAMAVKNFANLATFSRSRGILTIGNTARFFVHVKSMVQQRSNSSSSNQEVISSLDANTGIATLKLNNPPVNSLTLTLMQKFMEELSTLEKDPKCAALIITSNVPNMFSGGLDLKEFYRPKRENYLKYYGTTGQLWTSVYSTRLATVAALNGSSPAFGCILSLCCDYRIMKTGKGMIGLPEVHIGIPVSTWIQELYKNAVGRRRAELDASCGTLYNPEEALRIGLIDEVATSDEELQKKALQRAELFTKLPAEARHKTKMALRQPLLDSFLLTKEATDQLTTDRVMTEKLQASLEVYLNKLRSKK